MLSITLWLKKSVLYQQEAAHHWNVLHTFRFIASNFEKKMTVFKVLAFHYILAEFPTSD